MKQQRFLALLLAAVVVLGGGLWLSARRESPQETQGTALLPALAKSVNAVTSVQIRKGAADPAVTLQSTPAGWVVAQRADYPADVTKLRKLLLALRDAKIVEVKTANPALFDVIGVDDPRKPGSTATEVTVLSPDGTQGVIVGKPVGEGNFVRRAGENQAYSVEPSIAVDADPRHWLNASLLDLKSTAIQSLEFKPGAAGNQPAAAGKPATGNPATAAKPTAAAGQGYTLRRGAAPDDTFSLGAVPAGRKALAAPALAPSQTTFAGLEAEDVAPVADIDFAHPAELIVTLAGGNVVTLDGVVSGDKHWVTVQATKDPALTSKTKGRAFAIASYRYDAIFKPLDELLEPLPTQAKPGAAGPGPGGSPSAAPKSAVPRSARPKPAPGTPPAAS